MGNSSAQHKGFRIAVHDWFRAEGSGPTQCGFACEVYDADGQIADIFEGPSSSRLFNSPDEAVEYARSQIDAGKLESRATTPRAPDTLYHYCDARGFHGILASETLWMSDACCMKDSEELRLILDKAVEQLDALAAKEPKEPTRSRFCEKLKKSLLDLSLLEPSPLHPYVCCFSLSPHLPNQWKEYAGGGTGFAIGFSGYEIDNRCFSCMAKKHMMWHRVEYDPCKQSELLGKVIEDRLAQYLERLPKMNADEEGLEIAFAHTDLWILASYCKRPRFRVEDELRNVRSPRYVDLPPLRSQIPDAGTSDLRFRDSGGRNVPYFEFAFHVEDIVEIHFGPQNHENPSVVETFLRENGYDELKKGTQLFSRGMAMFKRFPPSGP